MNNRVYYFLIPFGLVLIITDAVLFYHIIGLLSVYLSLFLILIILFGWLYYSGAAKINLSNFPMSSKKEQRIDIKPVTTGKILFYKKILIVEVILIILLLVRIMVIVIS